MQNINQISAAKIKWKKKKVILSENIVYIYNIHPNVTGLKALFITTPVASETLTLVKWS